MKYFVLITTILISIVYTVNAQKPIQPSETISITGKVKNPATFTLADLYTFQKVNIKDLVILNHSGEIRDTITGMKGIPIKSLLQSTHLLSDKPKNLNEFYFVFTATDGYKVVFSWNEMYNTEVGNQFYIVTEMEGKNLREMDQRIVFISTADLKSGRRYIKGLEKIEVRQVEE